MKMRVNIAILSMLSLSSAHQRHERGLFGNEERNLRFQHVKHESSVQTKKIAHGDEKLARMHHEDPHREKTKNIHIDKEAAHKAKEVPSTKGKKGHHSHGLFDYEEHGKGKGKGKGKDKTEKSTKSSKSKGKGKGKGTKGIGKSEKGTASPSATSAPSITRGTKTPSISPQSPSSPQPTGLPTSATVEFTPSPVAGSETSSPVAVPQTTSPVAGSQTTSPAPSTAIVDADTSSAPSAVVDANASSAPSAAVDANVSSAPSAAVDANASSAPSAAVDGDTSDAPSAAFDGDTSSAPSAAVGGDASSAPSAAGTSVVPSLQPSAVGGGNVVENNISSPTSMPTALPLATRSSSCIGVGQGSWTSVSSIVGDQAGGNYGAGVSITEDGSMLVIGGPNYDVGDGNGSLTGLADTYTMTNGTVAFKEMIIGDRASSIAFGLSVAISSDGSALAVAADEYVELFFLTDGAVGSSVTTKALTDAVGQQVAISSDGSTIVTSGVDNNSVYVFRANADKSALEQLGQKLTGNDGDLFGEAVDINEDGTVIVVGAKGGEYAMVFELEANTWVQRGSSLLPPSSSKGDAFGNSVSISDVGDRVAVGTLSAVGNTGYVTIDDFDGSEWSRFDTIVGQDQEDFGEVVRLSRDGTDLVVGSPYSVGSFTSGSPAGIVHVYRDAGIFCQQGSSIVGEFDGLRLGTSLAISSDGLTIALGGIGTVGKTDSEIGVVNLYKFA